MRATMKIKLFPFCCEYHKIWENTLLIFQNHCAKRSQLMWAVSKVLFLLFCLYSLLDNFLSESRILNFYVPIKALPQSFTKNTVGFYDVCFQGSLAVSLASDTMSGPYQVLSTFVRWKHVWAVWKNSDTCYIYLRTRQVLKKILKRSGKQTWEANFFCSISR